MKKEIAYKLVTNNMESYIISCFKVNNKNKYNLKYKLNKTTRKVRGSLGIACFKDIVTLMNWVNFFGYDKYKILKIEGCKTRKQKLIISSNLYAKDLNKWYKNDPYTCDSIAPSGTVFFSSVMPIEIMGEG